MRSHPYILSLALCTLAACSPGSSVDRTFARQAGEVWYGIYLDGAKVGYARFSAHRAANGYVFSSSAAVRERNGAWTHWQNDERFQAAPPHYLAERVSRRTRAGAGNETRLIRTGDRYLLTDGSDSKWVDLDYRLRDRLGTETEGDDLVTRGLDVDEAAIRERSWKPTGAGDLELEDESGLRRVVLDGAAGPEQLTIGDGFRMQREPADLAVLVAEPQAVQAVEVPLDGAIGPPGEIARLSLRLPRQWAALIGPAPGQTIETSGAHALLTVRRTPARAGPANVEHDPRAAVAVLRNAGLDAPDLVRELVALVHASLSYDASVMPVGPRDALAKGRGSCRDYASLFALWAREMGLTTRIVTGLAYLGDRRGAFGLHAWNEVQMNGTWVAVDPTWNQAPADATHIRLPVEPDAMLRAFEALDEMRFELAGFERTGVSG